METVQVGRHEIEMAFRPEEARLLILAYPDGRYRHEIASWSRLFPDENVVCVVERDTCVARNKAVRDFCMASPPEVRHFVSIDADMRPLIGGTLPFLQADGDLVGCMYPTSDQSLEAWADPAAVHCGLYRVSRKVVETVKLPWFTWDHQVAGCEFRCECIGFAAKVRAAGLSIARAGWCGHRDWR
jgi:hypothetical protein